MSQRLKGLKDGAEATVRDIRRRTRKQCPAEEKIRIVVAGLRGEDSIAELCRREGIAESLLERAAPSCSCRRIPRLARRFSFSPVSASRAFSSAFACWSLGLGKRQRVVAASSSSSVSRTRSANPEIEGSCAIQSHPLGMPGYSG